MAEISRSALFGKLNSLCYKALEGSTVFCKLRGNPYVELVHFVHQLLQSQDSDLHRIIRTFELNPTKVVADLQAALDRLRAMGPEETLKRGYALVQSTDGKLVRKVEPARKLGDLVVRFADGKLAVQVKGKRD